MPFPVSPLDAARLRRSLNAKLGNEARRRGVAVDLVRKQYIFTIFLGRLFQRPSVPWVLLGGNALLLRTGGGRFTQDVDLAREAPWGNLDEVKAELHGLTRHTAEAMIRSSSTCMQLRAIESLIPSATAWRPAKSR